MKKIITCDIDGVLTDYPFCWLKYLQEKCGVLYQTTEEAKKHEQKYTIYKKMYRQSNYKACLPINECNKNALNQLALQYDIIFTTSRPINDDEYPMLRTNTYNWLLNNGLKFKELRFKDKNGDFLDDLDIEFHIDDEITYVNAVAEKLKRTSKDRNSRVYLINDKYELDGLDKSIIIVKNIQEIVDSPFFSVCIPATNRGSTIYRALKSIADQTYRNFELVIVDCQSTDNTVSEIERFFESDDYKSHPFKYIFQKKNYTPEFTEDWNDPVELANGKYIAMLEGDDYWFPTRLMSAYSILIDNPNIGIYGSSNFARLKKISGLIKNNKAKKQCYYLKYGAIPPSESIFIRKTKDEKIFLYNSKDYKYSPEIGLYLDIVLNGYDLFYSHKTEVYRELSTNPDKMKTWYYFADRFKFIKNYKKYFSKTSVLGAKIYHALSVMNFTAYTGSIKKSISIIQNLMKCVGIFITCFCFIIIFIKNIPRFLMYILRKIKK